ncbi:hypothetical protein [Streptomyces sp. S.PB5]|uniref:hypothetical protein n=1 Tax=Streptomyces sp. S.PB5 TaxID=3020844 RepID=UPI0025B1987B|nr:hypothetical protein [Streptomyces sp. S.PB5]MDN3029508.1 hypothetical protein [Streptomyces sp. S.PB5]
MPRSDDERLMTLEARFAWWVLAIATAVLVGGVVMASGLLIATGLVLAGIAAQLLDQQR